MSENTNDQRLARLRDIPLFAGLPDSSLQDVLDCANEVDVPANHLLVQPHIEGSGLFVIEEGTVSVTYHGHSKEMGPGQFFGELALLTPRAVRTARVVTKTPARLLAISRFDFRRILESEPKLALAMLEEVAERLVDASS